MAKKSKKSVRREYTKEDVKELRGSFESKNACDQDR